MPGGTWSIGCEVDAEMLRVAIHVWGTGGKWLCKGPAASLGQSFVMTWCGRCGLSGPWRMGKETAGDPRGLFAKQNSSLQAFGAFGSHCPVGRLPLSPCRVHCCGVFIVTYLQ